MSTPALTTWCGGSRSCSESCRRWSTFRSSKSRLNVWRRRRRDPGISWAGLIGFRHFGGWRLSYAQPHSPINRSDRKRHQAREFDRQTIYAHPPSGKEREEAANFPLKAATDQRRLFSGFGKSGTENANAESHSLSFAWRAEISRPEPLLGGHPACTAARTETE